MVTDVTYNICCSQNIDWTSCQIAWHFNVHVSLSGLSDNRITRTEWCTLCTNVYVLTYYHVPEQICTISYANTVRWSLFHRFYNRTYFYRTWPYLWVTRWLSYKKQELLIPREHLDSPPIFGRVRGAHIFSFLHCIVFLCFNCLCLMCPMLPVPLYCPFLIAPSLCYSSSWSS